MQLKSLYHDPRLKPLKDIAIFSIILLGFHFLIRYWSGHLQYWPIKNTVGEINQFLMRLLYDNSLWALQHLTTIDFTTDPETRTFWNAGGSVFITAGCSGFKPFLQWIFLMLLFPGPWKHKLWFIPAGLFITHLVNIFRIDSLVVILGYYPQHWHFTHDYILRPFFYVVMFGLWVFWVEKITPQKK
jgi:exosortase/archaeosortase family protein